jgi:predicted PurR-regulated permease PerM
MRAIWESACIVWWIIGYLAMLAFLIVGLPFGLLWGIVLCLRYLFTGHA